MTSPEAYDREKLRQSIEKLIAGEIDDQELAQLQEILVSDKAARELYYRCLDLDIGLRNTIPSRTDEDGVHLANRLRLVNIEAWGFYKAAAFVAIGIAILVIAALRVGTPSRERFTADNLDPLRDSPIASPLQSENNAKNVALIGAVDAEFLRTSLAQIGDHLKLRTDYALTSGMLNMRFPTGAEAIVEAPADFRIERVDCLIVQQGKCSVYAPPGAEGFQVVTPTTEVTDKGTRFAVVVNDTGDTNVRVIEGLAAVKEKGTLNASPIELRANETRQFLGRMSSSTDLSPIKPTDYRSSLPDRVISYEPKTDSEGRAEEVISVTVQRNGKPLRYMTTELNPAKVIHFRANKNPYNVMLPKAQPPTRDVSLEYDSSLLASLINFGGNRTSLTESPVVDERHGETTPGLGLRFREPVVNCPGPDVVVLEAQSIAGPVNGDPFHVSPLNFRHGLRSYTISRYDINLNSPHAFPFAQFQMLVFKKPASSISTINTEPYSVNTPTNRFWILAVGIDLSDLGFKNGETVDGLFLQSMREDNHEVDPVFIAALPPIDP